MPLNLQPIAIASLSGHWNVASSPTSVGEEDSSSAEEEVICTNENVSFEQ